MSWVAYIPAARASTQFVVNTWVHIMGPMMRGSNVVWVILSQQLGVPQNSSRHLNVIPRAAYKHNVFIFVTAFCIITAVGL